MSILPFAARPLRAPIAAASLAVTGFSLWAGAIKRDRRLKKLIPAGVAFTSVIGADTARRMGPALQTPDGRGPIHWASVTATGSVVSTLIPAVFLLRDRSRLVRAGSALYCCCGLAAVVSYLRFVRAIADEPRSCPDADFVVVCGAGLIDGRVSHVLRNRVESGVEIWRKSPDPKPVVILSGGQGADEPRSEASAMKECALELGIDQSAILMDEQSHSTEENLINSCGIIRQVLSSPEATAPVDPTRPEATAPVDPTREVIHIAVVSTDFHCRRIRMLIQKISEGKPIFVQTKSGVKRCVIHTVGASNPSRIVAHTIVREFVALGLARVQRALT